MSQVNVYEKIKPCLSQIESLIRIYKDLPPFRRMQEMDKAMPRILPDGVDYDFILRAKGEVQHLFFERRDPSNAIIL